jgi:hypothetical protein
MTSAVTGNAGAMSGLPRQADIISAAGYVRKVPTADILTPAA